jgi:hypothetical protein
MKYEEFLTDLDMSFSGHLEELVPMWRDKRKHISVPINIFDDSKKSITYI